MTLTAAIQRQDALEPDIAHHDPDAEPQDEAHDVWDVEFDYEEDE